MDDHLAIIGILCRRLGDRVVIEDDELVECVRKGVMADILRGDKEMVITAATGKATAVPCVTADCCKGEDPK